MAVIASCDMPRHQPHVMQRVARVRGEQDRRNLQTEEEQKGVSNSLDLQPSGEVKGRSGRPGQ